MLAQVQEGQEVTTEHIEAFKRKLQEDLESRKRRRLNWLPLFVVDKKHLGPLHSSLPLCYVHTAMGNFLVLIVSVILVLPFKPLVSTKSVFTVYLADYLTLEKISSWTFLFY